ncbi:hypothetical protein OTERR_20570 [Oryzomicrobium terrae]|uniref:Glycosyltransferase RgtA/B/C/D-like domain-containing protein n=1 Tax=Oryzomicrobium terrae TaxID=1735038 RepID=A0A5C1E9I4_9RHOO|nr:hypothetical protein [Oryzomicrobium terrae]QEL65533.1 hypothetical protein OTERR_20570 [Oryzomicrobium terrae]
MPPRPYLPLPWPGLILLAGLFLLTGLVGPAPWKGEDAINLGVAWEFTQGAPWYAPRLADAAFNEAPLYHWVAALLATLLAPLTAFHNGVRLSNFLWLAAALLALTALARRTRDKEAEQVTPYLLLGGIGLVVHGHEAQPQLAVLATQALGLWSATLLIDKPWRGLLPGGLALGLAYLAGGTLAAAPVAAMLLAAPCFPPPRPHVPAWLAETLPAPKSPSRLPAVAALIGALALAAALAALWLVPLAEQAPARFAAWLTADRATLSDGGIGKNLADLLALLAWFAWVPLPLAGWSLWRRRHSLATPAVALPLILLLANLIARSLTATQAQDALVFYVPLTALAALEATRLRKGAAAAYSWFAVITFTLAGAYVWLGWTAMVAGWPEPLVRTLHRLTPGFEGRIELLPLLLALAVTALWGWLLYRASQVRTTAERSLFRGPTHWLAGLTLVWVLVIALWLPWLEYGRSYDGTIAAMRQAMPDGAAPACVSVRLAPAQKALVRYTTGWQLKSESRGRESCGWLMIQTAPGEERVQPGWERVWEGHRPGDRSERLRLFKRR